VQNNSIASPLPHPPSPSAPASSTFSSTASPDPDLQPTLAHRASTQPTPLASTSTNPDAVPIDPEVAAEDVVASGKKVKGTKGKGKGKKKAKGTKSRSREKKAAAATTEADPESVAVREGEGGGGGEAIAPTPPPSTTNLNRVCHHHKSLTKGEMRMTCANYPECRTIWCKSCVNK
jgi:hypothetical protein